MYYILTVRHTDTKEQNKMKFKKQNLYRPLPNGKEAHITNCINTSTHLYSPVKLYEELWIVHAMPYWRTKEFATKEEAINSVSNISN